MLRVGAKQLTCDASYCFQSAQKRDAMFSRRRSFVAAGVAAAIAPPTVLSNYPADVQTSVNLKRVTVAGARTSWRCDQSRRSAPKSCLQGYSPNPVLDRIWRPVPQDILVKGGNPAFFRNNDTHEEKSHGY
jgi:hypothetical protein